MLLLITGSRIISAAGKRYARCVVQRAKARHYTIIVGDACGIDEVVMQECHRLNTPCIVVGAGRIRRRTPSCQTRVVQGSYTARDRYMVKQCDLCIAIWNGKSHGTKLTYDYANLLGKPAWLRIFNE